MLFALVAFLDSAGVDTQLKSKTRYHWLHGGYKRLLGRKPRWAWLLDGGQSRHYYLRKNQRLHWNALAEWTRFEGLCPAMLEMLTQLDTAIERVDADLHPSVLPSMAKQIYDGARAQAHRFLAVPD